MEQDSLVLREDGEDRCLLEKKGVASGVTGETNMIRTGFFYFKTKTTREVEADVKF